MEKVVDKRAIKSLKAAINRIMNSKSAVHLQVSKLIAEFSHASSLVKESRFESSNCHFFVVHEVMSPFFVRAAYKMIEGVSA